MKRVGSLEELQKIMNDDSFVVEYCEHHDEPVDQGTFEYKGCWTCWQHFRWENRPYISVEEEAELYGVCKKTIYRWIKQGKLKARLFRMGRINLYVPKKFYAVLPEQPRPRSTSTHKVKRKKTKTSLITLLLRLQPVRSVIE